MELDELLAREAIRDLVARYNAYGDAGKFDLLWELFVEDSVMEISQRRGETVVHRGLGEIRSIFLGTQDRVQSQDPRAAGAYVRHFTATHQIDVVDAEHATGRAYFAVIVGSTGPGGGLDHWGRYLDDYVRVDGRWRFARRRVILDGVTEGSWFSAPG